MSIVFEKFERTKEHHYHLQDVLVDLPHKVQVEFALDCASEVCKSPEDRTCLDLVQKWLDDPNSVTREQLMIAADAARSAYYAAYSAWSAIYAVRSAYYAAYAAWSANAWTAYYASCNQPKTIERYINYAEKLHATINTYHNTTTLNELIDTAIKENNKDLWTIIWDNALDIGLIIGNEFDREDIAKNPIFFYRILKRAISCQ